MNSCSYPGSVVPGTGSLVEQIDKRIFVWLRDGRMYVGILRSVDTFGNLVLHNTFERIQVRNSYADIPQGIILVRGENVALLGEMKDDESHKQSTDELLAIIAAKEKKKEEINKLKIQAWLKRGLIYTPEDYF